MLHNPLGVLSRFPPLIVATARRRRVLARPVKQCVGCCELSYRAARCPRDLRDSIFPSYREIKAIQVEPAAAAAVTFNLVSGESNFPTRDLLVVGLTCAHTAMTNVLSLKGWPCFCKCRENCLPSFPLVRPLSYICIYDI